MTRKELTSQWERAHWGLKALISAAAMFAAVLGVGAAWGLKGQELAEIPGRVKALEERVIEHEYENAELRRLVEQKVDSIGDNVAEIRSLLLDMTCEQSRTPAQCREERLRRP